MCDAGPGYLNNECREDTMALGKGKPYAPNFGEPWRLADQDGEHTCYTLFDRHGREMMSTPDATREDAMIARRVLDAINGVVNFTPDQLSNLAERWNKNAENDGKGRRHIS
jgi:hypothetical protein